MLASVTGPVRAAHGLTLGAAFAVWAYLDRHLWFYGDEWDFLTRRGLHGATFSLWAPHNEHWSVLPILLWRAIYSLWHLSSYWPYLVPALACHVAVVHLTWRMSLREGAGPWVATALAGLLALFGAGAEDLTWAFQVGFLGSLVFGLLSWEVAARSAPGPRPQRADALVIVLAVAAMMCSTVGLATAVGLGVVLAGRSGVRRAALVLAAPVCAYLVWFALAGHAGLGQTGDHIRAATWARLPGFVAYNLAHQLGQAAGWAALGPLVALALVAWAVWRWRDLFGRRPAVAAGLVSAVAFFSLAGVVRDLISPALAPSRYVYVGTAFTLPALAVGLSLVCRRARSMRYGQAVPVAVAALVVAATTSNVVLGVRFARARTEYVDGLKAQIVTTGALLQGRREWARMIKVYPIQASGHAAGYLTGWVLRRLYADRLLAPVGVDGLPSLQLLKDESWLDLKAAPRPLYPGRSDLAVAAGFTVTERAVTTLAARRPGRPGAVVAGRGGSTGRSSWPVGPGDCALARPRRHLGPHQGSWLRVAPAHRAPFSLWVSLGRAGGSAYVSLAQPWAPASGRLLASPGVLGEKANVPGGHLWVDDSVPGDGLVVRATPGATVELCGLSAPARPGTYAAKL